tara:strand:+ start:442 stop:1425 length:984 start_codon:yes stop_codon:yes gene_type:complete
MKKKIFSGIQPTGVLTIGNYLGAIKKWVELQNDYECLFCIADLHALTNVDCKKLWYNVRYNAALYIAGGLDPEKVIIFQQSQVQEHVELAWILSCVTPTSWLDRMTQFKDKTVDGKKNANLGLYSYPVLMSADILLYQTDLVPVGEDQKQHIELTRDIAKMLNRRLKRNLLQIPEALTSNECKRIMGLKNTNKKMSKSDVSDYSRINMCDSADTIVKKIRKATTDTEQGISYDPNQRPEVANLLNIYCGVRNCSREEAVKSMTGKNNAEFKDVLAGAIVDEICPVHIKALELLQDDYIEEVLRKGAEKARILAQKNITEIKRLLDMH